LGSFFAGIKAGTLGGIMYVGGIAVFNVLLLYALQPSVLQAIGNAFPQTCPNPGNATASAMDCFQSVVAVDVPFIAFVAFFISLIYAGIFGLYYDSLPTRGPTIKGLIFGAIIGFNLIFFGFSGYVFDSESAALTGILMLLWTPVFGYVLGRLYKKYTRVVEFSSQDPALLKVFVDGRDSTGRAKTFATTSNHKLRAEVAEDASFKEWEAEGGITLDDSRSFETTMEVGDNGKLLGKVGTKY
jgi:hypothetical protein